MGTTEIVQLAKEVKQKEQERLAADREAKLLKTEEDELKSMLMLKMVELGITSLAGDGVTANIVEKQKPYIADFSALEGYIREHGALDLLQKRLTESAVKLRWEDGIQIPGVGLMTEQKLQLK